MHGLYIAIGAFALGLLQLLVLLFWDYLSPSFNIDWSTTIRECGLLFFASATLGSSALSYFLNCKKRIGRKAEYFLFVFAPLVILTMTVIAYMAANIDKTVSNATLQTVEIIILVVTFIYLFLYAAYERSANP